MGETCNYHNTYFKGDINVECILLCTAGSRSAEKLNLVSPGAA